jgi:hypothetical protein
MRINRYLDIYGGITMESMAEGRFAIHVPSDEVGAMGVRLPTTEAEASRAKYCVVWPPTNQDPPFYMTKPSYDYSLRQGFDQDANDPFETDVSMVYPGFRENSTIPSGTLVRLFPTHSVVTLTSGNFINSADLEAGAMLSISYSGTDAGKPQYDAAGTVATVVEYDSDDLELTVRIE